MDSTRHDVLGRVLVDAETQGHGEWKLEAAPPSRLSPEREEKDLGTLATMPDTGQATEERVAKLQV